MTSKLLKKVSLVLLMGIMLSQLSACKKAEPIVANEEDKMKGTLSVYYVDYKSSNQNPVAPDAYGMLLGELQDNYPDLKLETTTFPTQEAFMTQVSTEFASGNGPDIFLLDFTTKLNANKMVANGSYENISPYMKKDNSFELINYYEPALKAGEFNGKQYIIPFGINFTNLYTTKEKMKENNISLDGEYTYKDVLSALQVSVTKAEQNDKIIPLVLDTAGNNYLTILLSAFGVPIAD